MPATFATWQSHFGFALETVYGTTVATPTVWIPVNSFDEYTDDMGLVFDEGIRASATKLQAVYQGVKQGAYSATFNYYPNECARFFAQILAKDTVGSSSNGYWQHTIATSTGKPNSATLFDFFGTTGPERQFVGAMMDSLNFKFSRASGTAIIKPHWISAAASTGIGETSASFGTVTPLRGWQPVFSIGASTKVTLLDYDLTVSRPTDLLFAGNNSQRPSDAEAGQIDVTGKLSCYASTDGPYEDYRANTERAIEVVFGEAASAALGSTSVRLDILLTTANFTKVSPDRSGPYVKWDIDFRGKYNATDGGAIQVLTTIATSSQLST
ncbi:MAG: phage tail tube protein [Gemmatimonadaceae bacterium]|nr:phage tail tube protein [Gemmatimonadaceae bacterium]